MSVAGVEEENAAIRVFPKVYLFFDVSLFT